MATDTDSVKAVDPMYFVDVHIRAVRSLSVEGSSEEWTGWILHMSSKILTVLSKTRYHSLQHFKVPSADAD